MGILVTAVAAFFLHLIAFVFAIGAEMRRSAGKVVVDKYDERTYCSYSSDASTVYGMSAFGALLLSQVVVAGVTRCLCRRRGLAGGGGSRGCGFTSCVISWISFLIAEACLLAGSVRNAYHTKYLGRYLEHDLTSCAALRKGVFAAAAAFVLISMMASLSLLWSHSKADTGGWVKHHNEVGVGMTDYGPDRSGLGSDKA